jgi:hypothetical protein
MTGSPTFNVYITTVDGVTTYASTTFTSGDQGTRYDSGPYRFKSITPVVLATGDYMLWGYGFDANNLNGNSAISAVNATLVSDGGIITLPTVCTYYHGSTGITVPNVGYSTGLQFASFSMALWAVDGDAVFGGSADVTFTPNNGFNYSASGKAVFGGAALPILRFNYSPAVATRGELHLDGTTSNKITIARTASGNAVFGGTAAATLSITRTASGNAVFGGSAPATLSITRTASGNAVFGGTAAAVLRVAYAASGNAVFGGSATTSPRFTYSASGNAVFGGTADASASSGYVAGGSAVFGGTAGVGIGIVYATSGNAVFGGAATVVFTPAATTYTYTGSGCMYLGGTVFDAPCLSASLTVSEMLSGTLAAVDRLSASLAATERMRGTLAAVDRLSASLDAENRLSATLGNCQ